ncbi:export-related chaperone CsaA [Desulfohalotomaculum tongense]|nr:export-related chaperone CsaA [Desulforadius tongensis]
MSKACIYKVGRRAVNQGGTAGEPLVPDDYRDERFFGLSTKHTALRDRQRNFSKRYKKSCRFSKIPFKNFVGGVPMQQVTIDDFFKIDIRIGTVIKVEDFPEARKPAYKLWIDFGAEVGTKKSSAQITDLYSKEDLLHRQVIAVVNFPPRQVAKFMSEVLVLGTVQSDGKVVLLQPERPVENGLRIS